MEVSDWNVSKVQMGYTWYEPGFWGTCLNPAVKFLMLGYGFEILKFQRIAFYVDQENLRSCSAMAKIGAVKEGILRKHRVRPDGTLRNSVVFSITDEDWKECVKEDLSNRLL